MHVFNINLLGLSGKEVEAHIKPSLKLFSIKSVCGIEFSDTIFITCGILLCFASDSVEH